MKKLLCVLMSLVLVSCCLFTLASCSNEKTDTIKVGMIGPYTGDLSVYGLAVQYGARLYFDEVNANGGINGKMIEVIPVDSKGSDTDAVSAYNRLKSQGVSALVAAVVSGNTVAVVGAASGQNMPIVTASATAENVTVNEDGSVNTYAFRACFIDPFQGTKAAQYAKEKLGAKKVAIIVCNGDAYSDGLAKAFVEEAKKLGLEVVANESYSKGDVDFSSQLTKIAAQNPDLVFCPNYYQDDGAIITQARAAGLTCQFLGGDGWDGVLNFASKQDLEGTVYIASYASGANEKVNEFESKFIEKWGADYLNMFAATAYDAAMLIVNGLKYAESKGLKTGSEDYRLAVIDGIKNHSEGVDGVTSDGYTFDAKNNPIKQAFMIKIVDGKTTFIGNY